MKKSVSVSFDFKGEGHGNISIFPEDDCPPYSQQAAGSNNFDLEEGNYLLRIEGVVSVPGAMVTVSCQDDQLASLVLPEGYFSRPLNFTV